MLLFSPLGTILLNSPEHFISVCAVMWAAPGHLIGIWTSFLKNVYLFRAVLGLLLCMGFLSLGWAGLLSSCGAQTPHWGGFSCCEAQALGHANFSSCSTAALAAQRYVGSPQTRDWIHVPCLGRWTLNYCITKGVWHLNLLVNKWQPFFSYIPLRLTDLLATPLPSDWEKLWLSDHELNYIINYQKKINRKEWEKRVFLWSWEHRKRKVGLNELPLLEWCDICSFAKLRGWHTQRQSLWIYKMDLRFLLKNLKLELPTHKVALCPSIYFDLIEGVLKQCSRNSSTNRTFKLCKNELQWFKSINLI